VKEDRAAPQRFAEVFRQLKPPVIQISGGEPLLRRDVDQIIQALKQPDGTPYMIFVTNAALLTREKYDRLREIGIDAFSVSLDYPDERHDAFRNIPGLFRHIIDLTDQVKNGKSIITFNCVVQHDNYRELVDIARLARKQGVWMNFSPYTWMRTNDHHFMIPREELPAFREVIRELMEFKRADGTVRTSDAFFDDMVSFFENESIPHCRAGERFLVVNPDASLSPCGLIMTNYATRRELREQFSKHNTCVLCNTCIRASTEKPLNNLIASALRS
jgi:MoaA/NifB/PqqE/SkfB family radical SAM enzyme